LTAGWVGEIGKDFEAVIKLLAREAAAGDDGMTVSPLVNTDRKGGAPTVSTGDWGNNRKGECGT